MESVLEDIKKANPENVQGSLADDEPSRQVRTGMKVLSFGKHKGTPVSEVPANYLEWMVRNMDWDEAVKTAQEELSRRGMQLPQADAMAQKSSKSQEIAKRNHVEPNGVVIGEGPATHYRWSDSIGGQHWIPKDISMDGREKEECPFGNSEGSR